MSSLVYPGVVVHSAQLGRGDTENSNAYSRESVVQPILFHNLVLKFHLNLFVISTVFLIAAVRDEQYIGEA
jgi:hypothetical protein